MAPRHRSNAMAASGQPLPDSLRYNQPTHTFAMGGHEYSCLPLDPLEQIHMARRLAPVVLSALKPLNGRKAIMARLSKIASVAVAAEAPDAEKPDTDQVISDALDLATSVFESAAATDEEAVNTIIRKCGGKIFRKNDKGGSLPIWSTGHNAPVFSDIDGLDLIVLVSRYLFLEFKGSIAEYLGGDDGIGAALVSAMSPGADRPRPPGAPMMGGAV